MVRREHLQEAAKCGIDTYKTLLSLDGGGMRGMITAVVLQRLEDTVKRVILDEKLIDNKKFKKAFDTESPTKVDDFDICLGDYFHMLAGTSTGGLLALYLGAQVKCGNHPEGTAAGAIHLYEEGGSTIFPGRGFPKHAHLFTSGLEGMHKADGLKAVLQGPLAGKTLRSLKTDTVVCSVDATNMRSAVFMGLTQDLAENKPVPTDLASQKKKMWTGFGTYNRQTVGQEAPMIACREGKLGYYSLMSPAHRLSAGDIKLAERNTVEPLQKQGNAWLPPFTYYPANFELTSVARATSAAPFYLPPCRAGEAGEIRPELAEGLQNLWNKNAVFVDGGMANNDPAMIGLMVLLTGHPDTSIHNTAILSIGCGAATDSTIWAAPSGMMGALAKGLGIVGLAMNASLEDKASFLHFLYNGLLQLPEDQFMRIQLYTSQKEEEAVPEGRQQPQPQPGVFAANLWGFFAPPLQGAAGGGGVAGTGLEALLSLPVKVVGTLQAAGGMVLSSMKTAGSKVASGVQAVGGVVTEGGRYMLGLEEPSEGNHTTRAGKRRAERKAAADRAQQHGHHDNPPKKLLLTVRDKQALDVLDDASENALDAYNNTGIFLADFYRNRMEDFVRTYVFSIPVCGEAEGLTAEDTKDKKDFEPLTIWLKEQLGSKVGCVKLSRRLASDTRLESTPAVLVPGAPRNARTLGINPKNPLIIELKDKVVANKEDAAAKSAAAVLFEVALLENGLDWDDPEACSRMCELAKRQLGV
jgi:patatin-like phospholipase/acyl hydrolase